MARNISFALTTPRFIARTKTVTRRMGWRTAVAGQELCGVKKGMGLRPGEKIERLGMIRLVKVTTEPLRRLTDDLDYGFAETEREGFPYGHPLHSPTEFVKFFCNSHKDCTPDTVITRLEYEFAPDTSSGSD
jgi:hypothetical protein